MENSWKLSLIAEGAIETSVDTEKDLTEVVIKMMRGGNK